MMQIWFCPTCGFAYEEDAGLPSMGIPAHTRWENIPADWRCPQCETPKSRVRFSTMVIGSREDLARLDSPAADTPDNALWPGLQRGLARLHRWLQLLDEPLVPHHAAVDERASSKTGTERAASNDTDGLERPSFSSPPCFMPELDSDLDGQPRESATDDPPERHRG